jgi:AraC-like DNA-binding protein
MNIWEARSIIERQYGLGKRYFNLYQIAEHSDIKDGFNYKGILSDGKLLNPPGEIAISVRRCNSFLNLNAANNPILDDGESTLHNTKRHTKKTPDDIIQKIMALSVSKTSRQISSELGVSQKTVSRIIQASGIPKTDRRSVAVKKALKMLGDTELNIKEIASVCGCDPSCVYKQIRLLGIKRESLRGVERDGKGKFK